LAAAVGKPSVPAWQSIRDLIADLDMPCTLRDVGIKRENLDELAKLALGYQPVRLNPRPIKTESDVMEVLEIAF
jgi:maleylacetate reductase